MGPRSLFGKSLAGSFCNSDLTRVCTLICICNYRNHYECTIHLFEYTQITRRNRSKLMQFTLICCPISNYDEDPFRSQKQLNISVLIKVRHNMKCNQYFSLLIYNLYSNINAIYMQYLYLLFIIQTFLSASANKTSHFALLVRCCCYQRFINANIKLITIEYISYIRYV